MTEAEAGRQLDEDHQRLRWRRGLAGTALCLAGLLGLPLGALAGKPASRAPSRLPWPSLADDTVSEAARLQIHQETPQFVLITLEEGSSLTGLRWLSEQLQRAGALGHVTVFLAPGYLAGMPQEARKELAQAWSTLAQHNDIGVCSPWQATGRCLPNTYDVSLRQEMARLRHWPEDGADLVWPFTLDHPLPVGVRRDGAPPQRARWGIPLADWRLFREGQDQSYPSWLESAPALHDPKGARLLARQILANLEAHLNGNRAPFHLGLRTSSVAAGHEEERAVLSAVLAQVGVLQRAGHHVVYASVRELIQWMEQKRP